MTTDTNTDADTDDDSEQALTVQEALDVLADDYRGDGYYRPGEFRAVVAAFAEPLADALGPDHDTVMSNDETLWLNRYLARVAKMAADADGMPTVPQYETLILVEDLSRQIAEDLGVRTGSGGSIGRARRKREAHDTTMLNLMDHFSEPTA